MLETKLSLVFTANVEQYVMRQSCMLKSMQRTKNKCLVLFQIQKKFVL